MKYFFLLMLAFILGANVYVFFRLCKMMPLMWGKILLIVLGIIMVSSIFVFFLGREVFSPTFLATTYKIGTSWFFIFIYLLLVLLFADLIRITHILPIEEFFSKSWAGFFMVTGLVAIILTGGYIHYKNKVRVEFDLALNKKVPAGSTFKIVAISDLHLGYSIGKKEFEGWIEMINKENPDIILIAGDMIDNSILPLRQQQMDESFRKFKSKHGVYACLGNHEYISGSKESIHFLKDAGVVLLKDSVCLVNDSFYLVGRDDRSSRTRKPISELLNGIDCSKPVIMLDHQPFELDEVEKNGVDLQISGHTHHGQIWPVSWITNAIYEKSHGYLRKGDSHIYVSSGIGLWGGKFRIGTQSEYVVINLIN